MNLSLCSTVGVNTGGIDCDRKKGVPQKFLAGSAAFDSTDWADSQSMLDAILAVINLPAGSASKLFPFPTIQGNTDNTEANTEGTLGYGLKFILREGRPAYTFQILCGETQYKALRQFNNTIIPIFIIDDSSTLWGTKNASGDFIGYSALIFVSGNPFEDGTSADKKAATVTVSFTSSAQFNDNSFYFTANGWTEADLLGLKDAPLALVGAVSATTKFEIKIPTAQLGVSVNLGDFYGDELEAAGLFIAKTGANFTTALPITSVTYNTSDKTWSVAFDATAYGLLASAAQIKVYLADPAVLYAAGVTGIEGTAVIITKP